MTINRFEDLEIWKKARELCQIVFTLTSREPFSKDYRFRDQIRAASGSVMDNIAEGYEREGNKEFIKFLSYSKGSAGEVRSQSYRAKDFEYINDQEYLDLKQRTEDLSKQISAFMKYLKNSDLKGSRFK